MKCKNENGTSAKGDWKKACWKQFVKKTMTVVLSSSLILGMMPATTGKSAITVNCSAQDASTAEDDWLHTNGSDIVDKNGNVVRLTGANWFGFNCGERVLHGLWSADLRETIKACADRGINILRIPISTELLLEWRDGKADKAGNFSNSPDWTFNPDLVNEDGTAMNTLQVMDKLMVLCKEYGVKVLIDCHSAKADNSGHVYPMWYNTEAGITTQDWIDGWKFIVERYKDDDTFIAADLENEPHGKRDETEYAKWDDTTDVNNWKYAASECAKAILDINPNMLILVEGIEQNPKDGYTYADPAQKTNEGYINYDGAWWGGNLRLVGNDPIDLQDEKKDSQIMYSPHDYGPSVYNQTWFDKDFTEQTLLDDYWYDAWAYLVEENISPLLMGEWGGHMDGGANEKWLNLLAEYMNKKNISHTFWCLNPNSGDTGGLLDSQFQNWDEEKYGLLKKTLWQTDNGQFIGLDHKINLGDNGLTVDEFYGTSTPGSTTRKPSSTTTEKPATTTENAVTTTTEPATTTENADVTTESSEDTTKQPSTTTRKPNTTTTKNPDATTKKPAATTESSEDTTKQPSTTTRKPNTTTTKNPAATTKKPAATTESSEDTTKQPSTTTRKPNMTTTKNPDATTKKPATTTENPDAATQDAQTTTREAGSTTENKAVTTTQKVGTTTENKTVTTTQKADSVTDKNNSAENTTQAVPVSSVNLTNNLITLSVGMQTVLNPFVLPSQANQKVQYVSSDSNVASVNAQGLVTGLRPGIAKILISAENNRTADCRVLVKPAKVSNVRKTVYRTKLSLKWKKQSYVTGYKVYIYDTKKKTYKLYKKTASSSLTIKGKNFKKLKSFRFKICAYKKSGATTLNGAYSKTVKGKIKIKQGSLQKHMTNRAFSQTHS